MKEEKRNIWSGRWGYPEGWAIVGGLLLISYIWQWVMGPIPAGGFTHPISTVVLSVLIIATLLIGILSRKRGNKLHFVRFIVSPAATITSLSAFLLLLTIMGFSKQIDPRMANGLGGLFHTSGWSAMIHSHPFNTIYIYLLLVLGSVTIRRLLAFKFSVRELGFMLNHLGLYGFLFFALVSGSNMQRYTMALTEDEVEWRGTNQATHAVEELPIALELKHFTLDEYPPKLMLLNTETGQVLPESRPDMLNIEEIPTTGLLNGWKVSVDELLPLGAPLVRDSTIVFSQFASSGGAPAAHITAHKGSKTYNGWVSCGSYLFPHRALSLDETTCIIMPFPEIRQYYATLDYYLKDGGAGSKVISVNDPLKVRDWYVYQLNFDEEMRRWATSTEVELVYDPWLTPVLVSIWVLFTGAIFLLLGPSNSIYKRTKKEEESL